MKKYILYIVLLCFSIICKAQEHIVRDTIRVKDGFYKCLIVDKIIHIESGYILYSVDGNTKQIPMSMVHSFTRHTYNRMFIGVASMKKEDIAFDNTSKK